MVPMVVAKRRWRALSVLRRLLMCALCTIALMALFSVHVTKLPADTSHKLPTQHELGYQNLRRERSWTREFAPPHLLKDPITANEWNASGSLDPDKLWKQPANRDYVPCTEPSSSYTTPPQSRGYLLVHANGGLNQMRAGSLQSSKHEQFSRTHDMVK